MTSHANLFFIIIILISVILSVNLVSKVLQYLTASRLEIYVTCVHVQKSQVIKLLL